MVIFCLVFLLIKAPISSVSMGELVAAMRDVVRQEATPEGWQATVRKHHSSFCESLVHHEWFFFVEQLTFAKHKTQLTARLQFSRFSKTHLVTSIPKSSPFLHLFSRPQIFGALRGRTAKVGEKGAFGQVGRCDPTSHGGFLDEEFWYFKNWWSFWQMILGFKESIKNRIPLFSLCKWIFFS